eukprot:6712541-Prymnesium_polylepis.1
MYRRVPNLRRGAVSAQANSVPAHVRHGHPVPPRLRPQSTRSAKERSVTYMTGRTVRRIVLGGGRRTAPFENRSTKSSAS